MPEQPRIGAYERPVAQEQSCHPSTPAQVDLDGSSAGSPEQINHSSATADDNSSLPPRRPSHQCPLCPRSFTTSSGLTIHRRTHDRNPTAHLQHLYGLFGFKCPDCTMEFNSQRAVSLHRRKKHPEQYNADCLALLPKKPFEWSELEDALLLHHATELWPQYSLLMDLHEQIHQLLPQRTTVAIKHRLRALGWDKNASIATRLPTTFPAAVIPVISTHSDPQVADIDPDQPATSTESHMPISSQSDQQPTNADTLTQEVEQTTIELCNTTIPVLDCGPTLSNTFNPPQFINTTDPNIDRDLFRMAFSNLAELQDRDEISDHLFGLLSAASTTESFDLSTALNDFCTERFPHRWRPSTKRHHDPGVIRNNRQLRRIQYGHIQNLYKRNRRDAGATILDGRWRNAFAPLNKTFDGFDEYWRSILSQPAVPDARPPRHVLAATPDLVVPITAAEVSHAISNLKGNAPGLDRIQPRDLRKYKPQFMCSLFNTFLACGKPPPHLTKARITFIPKVDLPLQSSDFRPISVYSVFIRLFHKILCNRWLDHFPKDRLQFGFMKKDGCFEATNILHAALRYTHMNKKSMSFAAIDISRAFDSISHDSLRRAAISFGAPPQLQSYLDHLYESSSAQIGDTTFTPTRGVRQGDPLSPLLFIMALDEALQSQHFMPWSSPVGPLPYLAYADDIILFAKDKVNLQHRLRHFTDEIAKLGLTANLAKTMAVNIRSHGQIAKCVLDTTPMQLHDQQQQPAHHIPTANTETSLQFLGVTFDWTGKKAYKADVDLKFMLDQLTKAPLKPQQRMQLLQFHLIPRLQHKLCLMATRKETLRRLDTTIRGYVKRWIRLPKDATTSFFYADINDGGLGLPHLQSQIALNCRDRLQRHLSSTNPLLNWALRDPATSAIHQLALNPIYAAGTVVTDKETVSEAWKTKLMDSADCCSLRNATTVPAAHHWIRNPERLYPNVFIKAIQLRAGVLQTKVRTSRHKPMTPQEIQCRGSCGCPENISHILQTCSVTDLSRHRRHNDVCNEIIRKLRKRQHTVFAEPHIPTPTSFIKPDLVIIKDSQAYVMDVAICDVDRLDKTYQLKLDKYGSATNSSAISAYFSSMMTTPNFSVIQQPLIFNNRGYINVKTSQHLTKLGLNKRDIADLCMKTIHGSIKTYNNYMRGAFRKRGQYAT